MDDTIYIAVFPFGGFTMMKWLLMLMLSLMCVSPAVGEEIDYPLTEDWQPPVITEDCIETEHWVWYVRGLEGNYTTVDVRLGVQNFFPGALMRLIPVMAPN